MTIIEQQTPSAPFEVSSPTRDICPRKNVD
jgi:hypothetical protein